MKLRIYVHFRKNRVDKKEYFLVFLSVEKIPEQIPR